MKMIISRLVSSFLCCALVLSLALFVPSCSLEEQSDTKAPNIINGENNMFIDGYEAGKVSGKLITSQTEVPNETIAVEVDPFMEESFLLQVDQNDNIESVRKVAEGDGKAIYAVAVADYITENDENTSVNTEAPTDTPREHADVSETAKLLETVKEQIGSMTGVNEVKTRMKSRFLSPLWKRLTPENRPTKTGICSSRSMSSIPGFWKTKTFCSRASIYF